MAEIYRSVNAAGSVAALENERGEVLRRAGRPGEAAGHFERALTVLGAVEEPDPGTHSAILNNLALTAYQQGDLARARRCLVRSLQVGPLIGDPVGRAITYDNLGVVEVELARAATRHPDASAPHDIAPRSRTRSAGGIPDGAAGRRVGRGSDGATDSRADEAAGTGVDGAVGAGRARITVGRRPEPGQNGNGESADTRRSGAGANNGAWRNGVNAGNGVDTGDEADARDGTRHHGVDTGDDKRRGGARAGGGGRRGRAEVHLGEAEGYFAAAERLFRSVLPEAVDDYLRSVLNRVDVAEMRADAERMDRLTRHAAEVAAHHAVAPENALEAVTMRGSFLHRRRGRPRSAVELMTARLPALLPDCTAERNAAALVVLLAAAGATGDPALVQDVTARIAELGGDPVATSASRSTAAARTRPAPAR